MRSDGELRPTILTPDAPSTTNSSAHTQTHRHTDRHRSWWLVGLSWSGGRCECECDRLTVSGEFTVAAGEVGGQVDDALAATHHTHLMQGKDTHTSTHHIT